MKKIYTLATMLLCAVFAMNAAQATYSAKNTGTANFGGKKFYINPGHGGHDSNDRPTALPCGVEMFYESDGNLDRGFHLKDFLVNNNANVRMSRTTNTSSDDLGLSTIAAYANSYGGYFMSLHSNGANASANYVVSFFRSSSSASTTNTIAGSKTMAQKVSDWHDACTLSDQTYSTPRALGDYSFYGYNLGVLRTNNCVGYLVESWFHDYRPEALRMKSTVYNKFLAWQIARAAMDSPGASGTFSSVVMGDIRDLSLSCGYTSYVTRNRDQYKAIEGATVKLLSSSGAELQSMTTDNCENGFYAFFDLTAGTYQVQVSKDGYKTITKSVTVGASAQKMLNFDLTQGSDTGISTNPSSAAFGEVTSGTSSTKTINVTTSEVTNEITITSDNSVFTVSKSTLPATGGSFVITCAPTIAGSYTGTITLKSGSYTRTIVATATAKNPPLTFTEIWNYSETSGVDKDWTKDKTVLRNMCYGDGKLYVVSPSASSVVTIVDARSGDKLGTVNTTGVSGGVFSIMDVQYVDGKLIASNLTNADSPLKVYVWEDVQQAPSVLLETSNIAGYTRIGDTFSVKGNLTSGAICYAAGGTSEANKIVTYVISGGKANTTPTTKSVSTDGTADGNLTLGLSPRVVPETSGKYWVMGQNYYPSLVSAEGLLESTLNPEALNKDNAGNTFTPFTFRGTQYAFATSYTPASASADRLKDGRAILVDGSDGWATATNIGEYPSKGLGTTRCNNFSGNIEVNVCGTTGVEMWVLVCNQGIAYYRYGTIDGDGGDDDNNSGDDDPQQGDPVTVGTVTCDPGSITLSGVYGSDDEIYTDVKVTDTNTSTKISVNSATSAITVTKLADWNDYTGGTIRLTLNTSFKLGAGTYTSYVAVQSGSSTDNRVQIATNVKLLQAGSTAVEEVGADVNAPVEYYNLQGVRVDADNLTRGIYIKRQGKKTSKILVK